MLFQSSLGCEGVICMMCRTARLALLCPDADKALLVLECLLLRDLTHSTTAAIAE